MAKYATDLPSKMWVDDTKYVDFFHDVQQEMAKIKRKGYVLHTYHEGYGLMLEEIAEYFDEVRKKSDNRDLKNVKLEVAQIAAICMRIYNKAVEDEQSRN